MNQLIALALGGTILLTAACSGGGKSAPTKEELIENVKQFEDSLKLSTTAPTGESSASVAYADKCLLVYRSYPKSEEAPKYLDKAHIILSGAGLHRQAVQYADTLLINYPDYKNRPMVLQSIASAYDIFIVPRKKDLVEKYYRMLLKENPDMPKEDRETIQNRLDHIDLTFEELIMQPQKK